MEGYRNCICPTCDKKYQTPVGTLKKELGERKFNELEAAQIQDYLRFCEACRKDPNKHCCE